MPTIRSALYPFGFIGPLLYILRFWLQWRASERAHKTVVPPAFWQISILAGTVMVAHYTLQAHMPQAVVQWVNAYMAARNLQLMRGARPLPVPRYTSYHFARMGLGLALLIAVYSVIRLYLGAPPLHNWQFWISPPCGSVETTPDVSLPMHVFGILGAVILALRFWVQWFFAERSGAANDLGLYFWIMSLAGSLISIAYNWLMGDWVTGFGPCIGVFLYARNLFIIGHKRLRGAKNL